VYAAGFHANHSRSAGGGGSEGAELLCMVMQAVSTWHVGNVHVYQVLSTAALQHLKMCAYVWTAQILIPLAVIIHGIRAWPVHTSYYSWNRWARSLAWRISCLA
jgi:hypothetical protein